MLSPGFESARTLAALANRLPIDCASWLSGIHDSSNLGALVPSCARICHLPRARAPVGRGCHIAAWIRDSSNSGALDSAWGNTRHIPRARAPWAGCGMAGWIRADSNSGALDPAWGNVYRIPRVRPQWVRLLPRGDANRRCWAGEGCATNCRTGRA